MLIQIGLSSETIIFASIGLVISYAAFRVIYDVYFHPLRNIPGPKMARIGSMYEMYYDIIKDGTYIWEIKRMHEQYGPIVRINSRSVHIHDPEYFSTVYAGSGRHRVDKEPRAVSGYTFPHSTIATINHDLHRKRRAVVSPYFSKRAVAELEPMIHDRLDTLCSGLEAYIGQSKCVDLTSAFSAFTADVVTCHFYGTHDNYLSRPDFSFGLREALTSLLNFYHISRFSPVSPAVIKRLPSSILALINPHFPLVINAREANADKIKQVLEGSKRTDPRFKSVIIGALTDPEIPIAEKSLDRLLDEGETIIFAGIDTTARTLGLALFHLLHNRDHLRKLRAELDAAAAAAAATADKSWTTAQLENLPFMRGVIQESLRLSYGLVVRIPRISTDETLRFRDHVIPAGTPVSQSTYLMNNDPTIFPSPASFDPERWVRAAEKGVNLDKYMVSFSKGSRGCLGINLSYAMLYLGVARVVQAVEMDLHDTTEEDMEFCHARGFSFPRKGLGSVKATVSGGVKARIERDVELQQKMMKKKKNVSISLAARLEQV